MKNLLYRLIPGEQDCLAMLLNGCECELLGMFGGRVRPLFDIE
jgi:hypothetical protein